MKESISGIRDGFRLVQECFARPQDISGLDPTRAHAIKVCELFVNEKLHLGDIVRMLNDDRGRVVHTLLEHGVIEERRKKLKDLPAGRERRQLIASLN